MTTFNPAVLVAIVADDVGRLRRCDVYRLLDTVPGEHLSALADYIIAHRPDLRDEVENVAEEIMACGGGTPPPTDMPARRC